MRDVLRQDERDAVGAVALDVLEELVDEGVLAMADDRKRNVALGHRIRIQRVVGHERAE